MICGMIMRNFLLRWNQFSLDGHVDQNICLRFVALYQISSRSSSWIKVPKFRLRENYSKPSPDNRYNNRRLYRRNAICEETPVTSKILSPSQRGFPSCPILSSDRPQIRRDRPVAKIQPRTSREQSVRVAHVRRRRGASCSIAIRKAWLRKRKLRPYLCLFSPRDFLIGSNRNKILNKPT